MLKETERHLCLWHLRRAPSFIHFLRPNGFNSVDHDGMFARSDFQRALSQEARFSLKARTASLMPRYLSSSLGTSFGVARKFPLKFTYCPSQDINCDLWDSSTATVLLWSWEWQFRLSKLISDLSAPLQSDSDTNVCCKGPCDSMLYACVYFWRICSIFLDVWRCKKHLLWRLQ